MKRSALLLTLVAVHAPAWSAFVSQGKNALTATAVMSGTPTLTINALPLAESVNPGKHFVIPVEVFNTSGGAVNTTGLRVDVIYQMFNEAGVSISAPATVPITFQQDRTKPSRIIGTGYIPRAELNAIANGGQLKYFFRVLQGTEGVYTGSGSGGSGVAGVKPYPSGSAAAALAVALQDAYSARISNVFEYAVGPQGSVLTAADTYQTDGKTNVRFEPGALSAPGTLRIEYLNTARVPAGPNGARPVVAYNIRLIGTTLSRNAEVALSYPADLNGRIADSNDSPSNLAPYWYDGYSWRLLMRSKVDTTLHLVKAVFPAGSNGTEEFGGAFALFATLGGASAANLRPAERIITPNGDGINDTAVFSGLTASDSVKIFDLRGRRVRNIQGSPFVSWDGRDDEGRVVESGIYVYQFTSDGDRISGVISVAK